MNKAVISSIEKLNKTETSRQNHEKKRNIKYYKERDKGYIIDPADI